MRSESSTKSVNGSANTLSRKASTRSTVSTLSTTSHVSVSIIGTIPFGRLQLHQGSEDSCSETTETNMMDSITEEVNCNNCTERGDAFVLLDFPEKFIIGHDDMAITTSTDRLLGFRDIPRGAHFLWVQLPDAPCRCGYWYITGEKGKVRVKQWDPYNEVLGDPASNFEYHSQRANIESTYPKLKPYDIRGGPGVSGGSKLWPLLTDAITGPFLDRITSKKDVDAWLVDSSDCVKTDVSSEPLPESLHADNMTATKAFKRVVGSELNFLFMQDFRDLELLDDDRLMSSDVEDTSGRVLEVLNDKDKVTTEEDVVAELQFTFATGTHLSMMTCLEQWWSIVLKIMLRSYRLATLRPRLCARLIKTLYAQLMYTETCVKSTLEEGEEDAAGKKGPSGDRLLYQLRPIRRTRLRRALARYKKMTTKILGESTGGITPEQEQLLKEFESLEAWLLNLGWDLRSDDDSDNDRLGVANNKGFMGDEEEDDDDLPVVVMLDENGKEMGLVSFDRD